MKTKPVTIRTTPEQEDKLLTHAHSRGIKRRATMAQIAFDKGMELLEAQAVAMDARDLLEKGE